MPIDEASGGLTGRGQEAYTGSMRNRNLQLFAVFVAVALAFSCRETGAPSPSPSPLPSPSPSPSPSSTGALVLEYDDFGPQVVAHTLVGMDWWQWEGHGDSNPATIYSVRVVVHRGLGAAELAARYPVDPVKKIDHRYVTVERALDWLGENIDELEKDAAPAKDAADRALTAGLLRTLRGTRDRINRYFQAQGK